MVIDKIHVDVLHQPVLLFMKFYFSRKRNFKKPREQLNGSYVGFYTNLVLQVHSNKHLNNGNLQLTQPTEITKTAPT